MEGLTSKPRRKATHGDPIGRGRIDRPGYAAWDLPTAARMVSAGLPSGALAAIREALDLTNLELAEAIQVSARTLARRKTEDRLPPDESERVYRLGRLFEIAVTVLGGDQEARAWMKEPAFALGDARPLDYARTEPGAALVERMLGQIEHGIPAQTHDAVQIWRITDARHAASAFSGLGAEAVGGRFNSVGRKVVYTSGTLSLAMLELLVQAGTRSRLRNHVYLSSDVGKSQVTWLKSDELPASWNALPYRSESQRIGDAWLDGGRTLVLAVPSVIVPHEWNYLVNPAHPDFAGLDMSEPRALAFDPRLPVR